ncbi:hypothetical protein EPN42_01470 [bacterium]|nr:MAG: hypothetical protein EPN42_01470 [bacterium]
MRRLLIALLILLPLAPARADTAPRLGNLSTAIAAVNGARSSITVSAYTLSPHQEFLRALEAAAARGVRVHLVLTGDGFDYAIAQNREIAARPVGMRVELLSRPIHLKALVVDGGRIVALDDENFSRCGALVTLDSDYALPVERAAVGDPQDALPLTLTKSRSLALEAALIDHARHDVTVETESFSGGNAVANALAEALARHVSVTLTVASPEAMRNQAERATLDALARAGATVYFQHGTAKGAIIDGRVGWIGSSNATEGLEEQIDWGYASDDPQFVRTLARDLAHPPCV